MKQSKEYYKEYYQRNKTKIAERVRDWRLNNPEKCKDRSKKCNKDWYAKNRDVENKRVKRRRIQKLAVVQKFKNRPCTDCQGWFEPCQMDFDHIRGVKVRDITHMKSNSLKNLLEEIDKCEVVCANCHRLRTWKRGYHANLDK